MVKPTLGSSFADQSSNQPSNLLNTTGAEQISSPIVSGGKVFSNKLKHNAHDVAYRMTNVTSSLANPRSNHMESTTRLISHNMELNFDSDLNERHSYLKPLVRGMFLNKKERMLKFINEHTDPNELKEAEQQDLTFGFQKIGDKNIIHGKDTSKSELDKLRENGEPFVVQDGEEVIIVDDYIYNELSEQELQTLKNAIRVYLVYS